MSASCFKALPTSGSFGISKCVLFCISWKRLVEGTNSERWGFECLGDFKSQNSTLRTLLRFFLHAAGESKAMDTLFQMIKEAAMTQA